MGTESKSQWQLQPAGKDSLISEGSTVEKKECKVWILWVKGSTHWVKNVNRKNESTQGIQDWLLHIQRSEFATNVLTVIYYSPMFLKDVFLNKFACQRFPTNLISSYEILKGDPHL